MNLLFDQKEYSSFIGCVKHKTKKAIKQTDKGFFKAYGTYERILWNYEPKLRVRIEEPREWVWFYVFEEVNDLNLTLT